MPGIARIKQTRVFNSSLQYLRYRRFCLCQRKIGKTTPLALVPVTITAKTTANNCLIDGEEQFAPFQNKFSNVSGALGFTHQFNDELNFKANAGSAFRAPNPAELALMVCMKVLSVTKLAIRT